MTESLIDPIKYYDNNIVSTLNLVKTMKRNGCNNLVFSSSATAMRDFIHVKTLDYLFDSRSNSNFEIFNVGLGSPVSFMEIINTFIKKNKVKLSVNIKEKRFGDLPISYCNNHKITSKIGWVPKYIYADACQHTWKYYKTYY